MNKEYHALGRYIFLTPYKARVVARSLKGRSCREALAILSNLPHKAARIIFKILHSAIANALDRDHSLDEEALTVKNVIVNEGPRVKRLWARGRGRADVLQKKMCHITASVFTPEEKGKD